MTSYPVNPMKLITRFKYRRVSAYFTSYPRLYRSLYSLSPLLIFYFVSICVFNLIFGNGSILAILQVICLLLTNFLVSLFVTYNKKSRIHPRVNAAFFCFSMPQLCYLICIKNRKLISPTYLNMNFKIQLINQVKKII